MKKRLDILLVEKKLALSRNVAQRFIMAGEVLVNGELVVKPSQKFDELSEILLKVKPAYVSRGGEKLAAALRSFELEDLKNFVCADIGASTGGFTDCLLQHGAQKVYAIDVGYGQLDWKFRKNDHVVVMERTNIRDVNGLPEKIDLITIDVSFISLKYIFPVIDDWFRDNLKLLITLIKPQFEAGREEAARGKGVIRDPSVHIEVIKKVNSFAEYSGFFIQKLIRSPLKGPKGNIEFLALYSGKKSQNILEDLISEIV